MKSRGSRKRRAIKRFAIILEFVYGTPARISSLTFPLHLDRRCTRAEQTLAAFMRSRNSVTRLAPSLGFLRLLKKKRAIAPSRRERATSRRDDAASDDRKKYSRARERKRDTRDEALRDPRRDTARVRNRATIDVNHGASLFTAEAENSALAGDQDPAGCRTAENAISDWSLGPRCCCCCCR